MELFREELLRQRGEKGYTPDHDEHHVIGELSAASYAYEAYGDERNPPNLWPWRVDDWRPKGTRENLIRAGALLLAERDRIDARLMLIGQKLVRFGDL